jgi:hypothetical protein
MNPVKNKDPNIFFDYISLIVRQFRLYYKSWPLFKESLITPLQAIYFPFLPNHKWVDIRFKSGRNILISAIHWKLLPSACRLDNIGVDFEFQKNAKLTRIDGLHIYSPLWTKNEAIYFKEVFFDDVYKVKKRNFKKSIVVDIGAYVGDSALASFQATLKEKNIPTAVHYPVPMYPDMDESAQLMIVNALP